MFSKIDKHDQEQTEIIDEVEFENRMSHRKII
jgi:hypothetical protein